MSGRDSGRSEKARRNEVLNKVPLNRAESIRRIRRKVWPDGITELDNRVLDDRARRYLYDLVKEGEVRVEMKKGYELFRRVAKGERDAGGTELDGLAAGSDSAPGAVAVHDEKVRV